MNKHSDLEHVQQNRKMKLRNFKIDKVICRILSFSTDWYRPFNFLYYSAADTFQFVKEKKNGSIISVFSTPHYLSIEQGRIGLPANGEDPNLTTTDRLNSPSDIRAVEPT
jgi:hypothetical protein